MIVLDASLATKLVIEEADSAAAEAWYGMVVGEIAAPDLIMIEVAQAVVRRVNMRNLVLARGREALQAWRTLLDDGAITLKRTDSEQMQIAGELAVSIGHPIKDCVYLTLAMEFDCELATCDARFAAKARTLYPAVKLLADYAAN